MQELGESAVLKEVKSGLSPSRIVLCISPFCRSPQEKPGEILGLRVAVCLCV